MRIYFTLIVLPVILVAVPVYWLLLRRDGWRIWFLALVSLGILATMHPAFAAVTVGLTLATHQLVELWKDKLLKGTRLLVISIAVAVVTLAIGKYGQSMVGALFGKDDWFWTHIAMPLGVSYFVFRLLQYVFDQLRGVLTENRFRDLLAFLLFLPTFPAGPLETYQGFYGKRSTTFDRELFYRGIRRIVVGYFKKAFVVDFIFAIYLMPHVERVASANYHFRPGQPLLPLAFVVLVFVRAYIDLSAYTDLAIGFSRLFGFRIMENFDNPLFSRNVSEFWRKWHISLSSWCRNNVYFPVFGLTRKVWLGLYASMLTMGLWHYVDLNWTVWGLYHGTGLFVFSRWEKYKKQWWKKRKQRPSRRRKQLMAPLQYLVTFLYVALGYAFVGTQTFPQALRVFFGCLWGPLLWAKHLVG